MLVVGLVVGLLIGGAAGVGAGASRATTVLSTVEVVKTQPITLTTEVVRISTVSTEVLRPTTILSTVVQQTTVVKTTTIGVVVIGGKPVDLVARAYHVVDGDTFDTFPSGRVRLADINTPERGQPGYSEATNALRILVLDKTVYLDVDNVEVMDSYNRLVALVYVDYNSTHVLNVNLWLVVNGYAVFADFANEFNPQEWSLYVRKD